MVRIAKMVWRTTPDKKELISLEGNKPLVHLYEATPADLEQLIEAAHEVLDRILDDRIIHLPATQTP